MFRRNFFAVLFAFLFFSSVAAAAEWSTDYAKALASAKTQNKRVLLDFTGSDWCGPCIQFKKQALSRPEFAAYAAKNLVLVEVDYPQRKKQSPELVKQNERLAKQYSIEEKGYPTVVLLDPNGKILREFNGYSGESADDLIAWI
ncbi:MAG: thioredoxin family protein, partial [Verrucomicrobiaceae bacterium]|nr:thioredoxin family protein [Verrucomicrobiaceae bacterium]